MDINIISCVAKRLLEEYGLLQKGWTFQWDNAKRRAGLCCYRKKTIQLSRDYTKLNIVNNLDDVIDTILHEIAHAIVGPGKSHGPEWKDVAKQVGARPTACYDANTIEMPKGRLVANCRGCGKVFRRHKQIKTNSFAYCPTCGPLIGKLAFQLLNEPTTTLVVSNISRTTPSKMRGM